MGLPTSPPTTSTVINRGALIVLEGCEDGTTSLQSTKLFEILKNEGFKAALWKFPDVSTPSGIALKAYQTNGHQPHPKTLHLLVSAHWWELMPIMKDHLLNGTTLIVDRYVYSAIAASTAAGLDLNWCKNSYVQFNNMEQKRMQDAFNRLAEVQWKILDSCQSNIYVHAEILKASIEVIERCRKGITSTNYVGNNNLMTQNSPQFLPSPIGAPNTSQSYHPPPLINLNGRHDGFSRPVHVQL
ncbi:6024_t:CDS:2 [Diversispora eburnea]|uniref:6024_t:CDS:1 n=1 Tax=Diversispora eburnea TaxID=1213867 RepID=A0A9N8ZAU1_9GLOM|nr:6024_t:CDS:2 [Diversispora eburnea]